MTKDKLYGVMLLLISALVIIIAMAGKSVEEMEVTPVLFTIPMGLYLLGVRSSNMTSLLRKGVKFYERTNQRVHKSV